jgi:Acetyltransferase (GNAT) domain
MSQRTAAAGALPAGDPGSRATDGLVYLAVHEEASWRSIAHAWDKAALEAEAFYLSHDWLCRWWATYGRGRLAVGAVRAADRLIALAPLRRARQRFWGIPARLVMNLFNPHTCRSDIALLERGREALELVLDAVDHDPWDVMFLQEIPERSTFLGLLPAACQARGWQLHTRPSLDSPYLVIEGEWEDFYKGLSSTFRKGLRGKRNRLRASGVTVEIQCARGEKAIAGVMPEVMGVAERSWSGERGSSISSPPNRPFYENVLRDFAMGDHLRVWTLRVDGALAAFEIHVVWGRTAAPLKACFDPSFGHLSVGSILEAHVTEEVFRSGEFDRYDLLGKADFYKTRWTDRVERHVEVFIFKDRPLSRILRWLEFGLRPRLGRLRRASQRLLRGDETSSVPPAHKT